MTSPQILKAYTIQCPRILWYLGEGWRYRHVEFRLAHWKLENLSVPALFMGDYFTIMSEFVSILPKFLISFIDVKKYNASG